MTRFLLCLSTCLTLSTATFADTVATDGRGDTITTSRTCDGKPGSLTCTRMTSILALSGATATRQRVSVMAGQTVTSTLSGTRFSGHTFDRTTTITR